MKNGTRKEQARENGINWKIWIKENSMVLKKNKTTHTWQDTRNVQARQLGRALREDVSNRRLFAYGVRLATACLPQPIEHISH